MIFFKYFIIHKYLKVIFKYFFMKIEDLPHLPITHRKDHALPMNTEIWKVTETATFRDSGCTGFGEKPPIQARLVAGIVVSPEFPEGRLLYGSGMDEETGILNFHIQAIKLSRVSDYTPYEPFR